MFPLQIKVTDYFQNLNYCEAVLPSGEIVAFDPFVGCVIELTNEDYAAGKGAEIKGKTFLITSFSVYPCDYNDKYNYVILPNAGGMIEVTA